MTLPSALTVDHELVVVAGDQHQRDLAAAQPLGGQLQPRLHALGHQPLEQLVARGLVARHPRGLVGRGDERVVADVGDVALELGQVLV